MTKYIYLALSVLLVGTLVKASGQDKPETKTRTLTIKLNYKGAGTVDEKHKIYVFVFDSPDFIQGGAFPIASDAATAKDGTVSFPSLSTSPLYVATAYDPSGSYDGQSGPPPSGSSMGLYSKAAGKPEPIEIEAGKAVTIDVPFDDTAKMP
ncbi:MAG: hypothetical protein WBW33_17540 [Bryobacteraceae bacterium]